MNLFEPEALTIDDIENHLKSLSDPTTFARKLRKLADNYTEDQTDEQFSEWWAIYPRRKGKGNARRVFRAAVRKIGWYRLRAATEHFADHCRQTRTETQFIPHPATWLNGERWDDETDSPVPTAGRAEQQLQSVEGWLRRSNGSADECNTSPAAIGNRPRGLGQNTE